MHSAERQAFEGQLAVLFGAFPSAMLTEPRIEAYWRGLEKMAMATFTRCVDRLIGDQGDDKLPSVNRIWHVSRELRSQAMPAPAPAATIEEFGAIHAYGNRAMLNYLMRKGAASYASLDAMLREKKRLCDAYKQITVEEPEASLELRDKLFEAWDAAFEHMPPDQLQSEREFYCRTNRVRGKPAPLELLP